MFFHKGLMFNFRHSKGIISLTLKKFWVKGYFWMNENAMKKQQSYKNHKRIDPIYHYLMLPLSLVILGLAMYLAFEKTIVEGLFYLLLGLAMSLAILKLRFYPRVLQNRLIRTEMRLRYHEITGKNFQEWEEKLTLEQIIALRFAGDAELEELTQLSIDEKLSPQQIKERIKVWNSDTYRV